MSSEFCQTGSAVDRASVDDTTYLVVSLKNGAPGSSSAVRLDQAGANISYVVRPSMIPSASPVTRPRASPIRGSNPNGNVQLGASMTPSRLMNSCTRIEPTLPPWSCVSGPQPEDGVLAPVHGTAPAPEHTAAWRQPPACSARRGHPCRGVVSPIGPIARTDMSPIVSGCR